MESENAKTPSPPPEQLATVENKTAAADEEDATQDAVDTKKHADSTSKPGRPVPLNPFKKRKVALFLAYVGHGYQGMQRNPGAKTIEDELFKALHAAGAISDANNDDHGFMKIHWMRAARTDKGVSAVGQVVSLKMVLEPEGMLQRINAALPEQIRVFGFSRATNGFDSRKHCDKRRYEYILPEWAFDPRLGRGRAQRAAAEMAAAEAAAGKPVGAEGAATPAQEQQRGEQQHGEGQQQQEQQQDALLPSGDTQEERAAGEVGGQAQGAAPADGAPGDAGEAMCADGAAAAGATGGESQAAAAGPAVDAAEEEAQPAGEAAAAANGISQSAAAGTAIAAAGNGDGDAPFLFDDACAQRLTQILSNYEGTHNYHNFTVRKLASAPDAKRYILSFRCPGTFEINSERWVKMVVVGQSFMLHQIRKMVGMAVAVMRGAASEECLKLALKTSADLNTPMAPELGLFLDEAYFDAYNAQWGALHSELRQSDFQAEVDAFKTKRLYPHIAERDAAEGINATWLRTLNEANYGFRQWEEQVSRIRQGGGRRPPPKGAGAAALVGGMESYGQKRLHDGGGRHGQGKRMCGGNFGGRAGRVLPPPHQRPGNGSGGTGPDMVAAELSD